MASFPAGEPNAGPNSVARKVVHDVGLRAKRLASACRDSPEAHLGRASSGRIGIKIVDRAEP